MDAYVTGLQARQSTYQATQAAVDRAEDADATLPFTGDVETIRASWGSLSVDQRRQLPGSAIECVFVRRRNSGEPVAARTFICGRGAEVDLPGKGRRNFTPTPFVNDDPAHAGMALAQDRQPRRSD